MRKILLTAVIIAMGLLLAGCGAQKNELDLGNHLVQTGKCEEAQPHLDATISKPDTILDLAYAYFLKGQCAEKAGDFPMAYKNYYAAKIVACYAVERQTHVNLNTYGRSEFCQRKIPEKLVELAPKAGDTQALQDQVDLILHERYLEGFATE